MTGVQTCALPIYALYHEKKIKFIGAEETESEDIDYSSMKVAELKELLKERDLPISGKKSELIERLQT